MIKRRDKRGRILHNGESQLSDGRYRFKPICLIILPPDGGNLTVLQLVEKYIKTNESQNASVSYVRY
ncbi:MAG: integrase DNA-binding domain-containing protein [Clostridiales bacterium]|nr:integrase DNA-binding domain-containing protein [Clostridiales bacterium]